MSVEINRIRIDYNLFQLPIINPNLKRNIFENGLLNPITIDEDYWLIDGLSRLTICRELGHTTIMACKQSKSRLGPL